MRTVVNGAQTRDRAWRCQLSSAHWFCVVRAVREVSADGDRALGRRLAKAAGAVAAGLLVAASFPPLGWWLSAIVGLALLAWVLADPLTSASRRLRGRTVVRVGVLSAVVAVGRALVGPLPWMALAVVCALFPAIFAVPAVLLRALTGWPLWWAAW